MKTKEQLKRTRKSTKWVISIVFTLLIIVNLSSCSSKTGTYNMGFFYCGLYESGRCSIWQAESITSNNKSCLSKGSYQVEGEYIVISGLYNENCQSVAGQNGRYLIEGNRMLGPR